MINIMFVCFGNICRSPMAEFVMKDLVAKAGESDQFKIESSGCYPREGNPMSQGTREQLRLHNIAFTDKRAAQLKRSDYNKYDYIIGMDRSNVKDIKYIMDGDVDNKIYLLLKFAGENRDVDDPWYTDDFETTYADVLKGCRALLAKITTQS